MVPYEYFSPFIKYTPSGVTVTFTFTAQLPFQSKFSEQGTHILIIILSVVFWNLLPSDLHFPSNILCTFIFLFENVL